jgi:hypothetical protein
METLVGFELDVCEADPGITDELFNAELVVEEPCDESNHEGTEEEESSDDDLSRCTATEDGQNPLASADSKLKTTSQARDARRNCKARLGPIRMRTCRVGQIETRVVDFYFPDDGRSSGLTNSDSDISATALDDAVSAATTPAMLERNWPLYYKVFL